VSSLLLLLLLLLLRCCSWRMIVFLLCSHNGCMCVCVLSNIGMIGVAPPWPLWPRPEMYVVFAPRRFMGKSSV